MPTRAVVRTATADDVAGVAAFGRTVIPAHYSPLIGAEAAAAQVERWWGASSLAEAVADGLVVVAVDDDGIDGVAQRGQMGSEHVVWKLYVHPDHRGSGLGPRLLEALLAPLPDDVERVWIEHVAANARAAAFYEREGFAVQRVEADPSGDHRCDQVWRSRPLRRET